MSHTPVLLNETLELLAVKQGGKYVDGTLGRAGHSSAIIKLGGEVLGIDRDDQALNEVAGKHIERLHAVKGQHGDIFEITRGFGWDEVDGILLDLGVSSPQLDEPSRGFSFMHDGPLDMRMDASSGITAATIVNSESEEALATMFRELGEEMRAGAVARAIVKRRAQKEFVTTLDLAAVIERVSPRRNGKHPATKVFQALRMAVNDELGELRRALVGSLELLKSGARLAVITFESITDREVKRFFASHAGREVALQQGGSQWEGELPRVRQVVKKAVKATEEEVNLNVRSRSAKLRVVEKM